MKKLIISSFLLSSLSTFASDGLLCAIESATYYKRVLETEKFEVDKYKHCTISCIVGIECGVKPTAMIGVAKELYDLFGGGTPELEDLVANLRGLKLSQHKNVQNFEECSYYCKRFYTTR